MKNNIKMFFDITLTVKKQKKNASKIRYGRTPGERTPIGTTGIVQLNFIHNLI